MTRLVRNNVLFLLPSLELGFAARLEAIESLVKPGGALCTFPDGSVWAVENLWVTSVAIVDRPEQGAYRLAQHADWLREHVVRAALKRAVHEAAIAEQRRIATSYDERRSDFPSRKSMIPRSIHPSARRVVTKTKGTIVVDNRALVVVAPKPVKLDLGRATEIGSALLTEYRADANAQIDEAIVAAIAADDVETYVDLESQRAKRLAAIVLTEDEIVDINRRAAHEARIAKLRDPHFGESHKTPKAKETKGEKDNKKKGRGRKAA